MPAKIRRDLYARSGAAPTATPPSKTTIWRVLTSADAEAFDAAVGTWLTRGLSAAVEAAGHIPAGGADGPVLMQVRLDGKTAKGAVDAEGNQMHLLAGPGRPPWSRPRPRWAPTNEVPKDDMHRLGPVVG